MVPQNMWPSMPVVCKAGDGMTFTTQRNDDFGDGLLLGLTTFVQLWMEYMNYNCNFEIMVLHVLTGNGPVSHIQTTHSRI